MLDLVYKNWLIEKTKTGFYTANVTNFITNDVKVLRSKNLDTLKKKIDAEITEPGSKRAGKSHKTFVGTITASRCLALYHAQKKHFAGEIKCFACETALFFGSSDVQASNFALDHLTPVSFYDKRTEKRNHNLDNLIYLCRECNSRKSDKMPNEYFDNLQLMTIRKIQNYAIAIEKNKIALQNDARQLASYHSRFARKYDGGKYRNCYK